MSKDALVTSLAAWVRETLTLGRDHCIDSRRQVRVPGAGPVDLVAVRHAGDRFEVALWSITTGAADDRSVDAMMRRIHAFEAWYSELRERAELQGFSPRHRITVSGNLVARSVRRSPLVDLLSTQSSSVSFWTWRRSAARFDVVPFYGACPALASSRSHLQELFFHLPWEDVASAGKATLKV